MGVTLLLFRYIIDTWIYERISLSDIASSNHRHFLMWQVDISSKLVGISV